MTKTFKVAAAQVRPVLFDLNGSLNKVLLKIQEAATKDVKLIVFPETFLPYYPYFSFVEPPVLMGKSHMKLYEQAVEIPGPVTDIVGKSAKKNNIHCLLYTSPSPRDTIRSRMPSSA